MQKAVYRGQRDGSAVAHRAPRPAGARTCPAWQVRVSGYRTILVAVDDSLAAASALHYAAALAIRHHARLIALTVVPTDSCVVGVSLMGGTTALVNPEQAYAEVLRRAVATLPPDVGVETRLTRGEPAREILEEAERRQCDVIVMGFSARGWLRRRFGRSVSRLVERDSSKPVLRVPVATVAVAVERKAFDEPVAAFP